MKTMKVCLENRKTLRNQKGSILILAVIFLFIGSTLAIVGTQLVVNTGKKVRQQQMFIAEANSVARAGVVDTLNWFRRQGVVSGSAPWPHEAFYPRELPNGDTLDETIGLVKEFNLSHLAPGQTLQEAKRWGRYEVRRQIMDPTATATPTPDPLAARDVSAERLDDAAAGSGQVWKITSIGYVYRLNDPNKAFNEAPNEILAKASIETEFRRLELNYPPCPCTAVNSGSPTSTFRVINRGKVIVPDDAYASQVLAALCYIQGVGSSTGTGSQIVRPPSVPANMRINSLYPDLKFEDVFGMSPEELRLLSDIYVENSAQVASLLKDGFDMKLVFVNGNADFNGSTLQLKGSGILVVMGNLTLGATTLGKSHIFDGIIYVQGNAVIQDLSFISGTVIAQNGMTIGRSGAFDEAWVEYNQPLLNDITQRIGQYREVQAAVGGKLDVPEN